MAHPIVHYNAFLKSSRRAHGLDHKQAQSFYRGVKSRLDKIPTVRDIRAHPRISQQEARKISEVTAAPTAPTVPAPLPGAATASAAARGAVTGPREIFDEEYFADYDVDFIEGDEDSYAEAET